MVNGILAINFSDRLKQILIRDMALTVVVKLLGVQDSTTDGLCNILKFCRVQSLEKYLGVPLFHNRIIASTLCFVADKVLWTKYEMPSKLSKSISRGRYRSVRKEGGFAAVRGITENREGEWILGFNRFLGNCSIFYAELWGILDSLTFLRESGIGSVLIETDNLEATKAL
ncbi:hypothetical protein Gogos_004893 [Gossypium gossypioides]|uniref:RNase H type-1 domain-containing protein n=1 Tax=Gossypium gossypioides TaxID=34282 RepID=A0A7J9CHV4_GOSGO|nr:hypothetical protein [Gossypium gossypioides]